MRTKGILKNFMVSVALLSLCLVLLWVGFYCLTIGMIRRNMKLQAETSSEAIISSVEEELLALENAAYDLGRNENVAFIATAPFPLGFYDAGAAFAEATPVLPANIRRDDHVIVYNAAGGFYRLRGDISNTTLKRCFYLMEKGANRTITVSSNDTAYIGSYETIWQNGKKAGYVALLMEQARMERILNAFNDLDYLGVALLSGDKLLCANKDIRAEDMERLRSASVFVREKEIGLSGCRLFVYCERSISEPLSHYFRLALPVTVLILVGVVHFFMRYLRRHMVEPVANVIAATHEAGDIPLPRTGEQYLDSLVEHVNDMLRRIEDRERELYESKMLIKEAELEKERTLITLLKKQISAHFTVNTLNVVRALIHKGEKDAAMRICDELSTLLRYANAGDEYISLLEEFYVLEQYIQIMQARYPDKITVDIEEDDAFAEVFIPRMLLQPILENAIVHGLGGGKGKICVSAELDGKGVVVSISDNGAGMGEEALEMLRERVNGQDALQSACLEHIALQNIQRRIQMVCGKAYGLEIRSRQGEGTQVLLRLPVMPMQGQMR
ncbi:MAG: histidine kinase [Lachnospiraceae bacterium]|nr:histidine kinase [Lachnospiraceae bacterium]